MPRRSSVFSSHSSSFRRGAARRPLRLIVLLAAGLGIPSGAEATWDFFGEIRFTGGKAENPRLLDPDQPASLRRGRMRNVRPVVHRVDLRSGDA